MPRRLLIFCLQSSVHYTAGIICQTKRENIWRVMIICKSTIVNLKDSYLMDINGLF